MISAIFPIPNCVTFPGQTVALHVFEPRYRKMVRDCVAEDRPLAACTVKRMIEKAKAPKSALALQFNLSTFEPVKILSFGKVRIEDELEDGRLLISVQNQGRARITEILQREPYLLGQLEKLPESEERLTAGNAILRAELAARFEGLWKKGAQKQTPLPFKWDGLSLSNLAFSILAHIQVEPVLAQLFLEEENPERRASLLLDLLFSYELRST